MISKPENSSAKKHADDALELDEADLLGLVGFGLKTNESLELTGNRDKPVHRLAVDAAHHFNDDRQPLVQNERKGMRGIGGDRRQDREDVRQEKLFEPGALAWRHLVGLQHVDAGAGEFRLDRPPDGLLVGHEDERRTC